MQAALKQVRIFLLLLPLLLFLLLFLFLLLLYSSLPLHQERLLPGVMMASEKDIFLKLEQLCQTGEPRYEDISPTTHQTPPPPHLPPSPSVICAVRNLLKLIPINQRVLEALEVFIHQTPHGASDDTQAPPTPQEVLKEFYDATNVSQTQLLYNLEVGGASGRRFILTKLCYCSILVLSVCLFVCLSVMITISFHQVLSGKLMPAISTTADTSSQLFRRNFLEAGGLQFVVNVLQKNAFPSSTDLSIRQDCYAVALSLARCVETSSYSLCVCEYLLVPPPPPPPPPPLFLHLLQVPVVRPTHPVTTLLQCRS